MMRSLKTSAKERAAARVETLAAVTTKKLGINDNRSKTFDRWNPDESPRDGYHECHHF
jgi:hypothetical protein